MAEIGASEGGAAFLSLYLNLEEDRFADIEVVSRAAITWSAAIKEIAYHIGSFES
jgi:hypothetical protein